MEISFSRKIALLGVCLLLVFAVNFAFGQGITTGSVNGTVEDPQHAVVVGAKVTATAAGTGVKYEGTSNSTGYFNISSLPVGTYSISVDAAKFSKLTINNVQVTSGVPTSLGARILSLGTQEVVTVESGAPLVQSDPVNITGTFETKKLADLPIGNGFDSAVLYTPGVVETGSNTFSNSNGAGLGANGQRGRANNFQIDGQSNNDNSVAGPSIFLGNQDAIEEVQVLTNYDAAYGRNAGSVINYVTKQGGNAFHGTAYELYNGNWADSYANEEKSPLLGFCTGSQTPDNTAATGSPCTAPVHPRYVDNRFGGTLGGPIWRNKIWFFGSGHFERQRQGAVPNSSGSSLTPTDVGLAQLAAAFPNNASVAALQAIGPTSVTNEGKVTFTNTQTIPVGFGGNIVPVEFGVANRGLAALFNDYEGTGRVDYQMSSKDHIFGRYIFQQSTQTAVTIVSPAGNAQGEYVDIPARDQQIGLDWARSWTNSLVNQLRFSYSRAHFFFEGGAYPNCVATDINNCPTNVVIGRTSGVPMLGAGTATNIPQGRLINVTQYQDNLSWQRGRHTFKFGGDYDRQRSPNVFLPNTNASFTFTNFNTFLAGTPSTTRVALGQSKDEFKEQDLAFYAQDTWRWRDNLTLDLGLRWEWNQQAVNLLNDRTVARESNPATAFWDQTLPLSLRTVPKVPEDLNNFGPVFGFAYTPRIFKSVFGEDKTIIRGGFRIAYDPEFYNMFLNVATSTPTVNSAILGACVACLPASGNGGDAAANVSPLVPLGANPGFRSQTTVNKDFHNPYTEQWNFGMQREITSKIVAEVRYVGNHTVGIFQDVNPNPALNVLINPNNGTSITGYPSFANVIPSGLVPCTTAGTPGAAVVSGRSAGYVDCTHTNVLERANVGFSNYHGLQSQLRLSNWHGMTAGLSYTFSHTIDDSSEVFNTISGGNSLAYPQNPFNGGNNLEKANSGLDFPHVATLYMLYDLPWYKNQQGWMGKMLGGFSVNPTWRYSSGQPYTVIQTKLSGPFGGQPSSLCDPTSTFSGTFSTCHPFLSNPSAAPDTIGQCTDFTLVDCGIVNFNDGNPTTLSAVHFIYNDLNSDAFFGTPFGNGRSTERGQTIDQVNLAVLKNTKVNERLTVQLRAVLYNAFNRQFRGVPDPLFDDGTFNLTTNPLGSFHNNFFNASGGDSVNPVFNGIGKRRLEVGLKLIF